MPEARESEFETNLAYEASSKTPKDTQENPVWGVGGGEEIKTKKGKNQNLAVPLTIRYHPPKSCLFFCGKIIRMHYYTHLTAYQSYINTELYILELLILPPKSWKYTGVKACLNYTFFDLYIVIHVCP